MVQNSIQWNLSEDKCFEIINLTLIDILSESPNKTLSGVLGSFIFSLFSIFIINEIAPIDFSINFFDPKFFFIAIILSLIAQLGDLIISYFKRLEKIKDTGKILPGHGGILDRIDGLMFAVIFAFVLIQINIIS